MERRCRAGFQGIWHRRRGPTRFSPPSPSEVGGRPRPARKVAGERTPVPRATPGTGASQEMLTLPGSDMNPYLPELVRDLARRHTSLRTPTPQRPA